MTKKYNLNYAMIELRETSIKKKNIYDRLQLIK